MRFVDIVIPNHRKWEEKELSADFHHTLVVVIIVFLSTRELEVSYVLCALSLNSECEERYIGKHFNVRRR